MCVCAWFVRSKGRPRMKKGSTSHPRGKQWLTVYRAHQVFGMTPKVRKCTNFPVFFEASEQRSGSFLAAFRTSADIGPASGKRRKGAESKRRSTIWLAWCHSMRLSCIRFGLDLRALFSCAFGCCVHWAQRSEGGLYESSRAVTQVDGLPPAPSLVSKAESKIEVNG